MNRNIIISVCVAVIQMFCQAAGATPWPFTPQGSTHAIITTYGEFQQYPDSTHYATARLHNGLDIYKKKSVVGPRQRVVTERHKCKLTPENRA